MIVHEETDRLGVGCPPPSGNPRAIAEDEGIGVSSQAQQQQQDAEPCCHLDASSELM